MKSYSVTLRYSKDGKNWSSKTIPVRAESDLSAMELAKSQYSRYPYVEITNVR